MATAKKEPTNDQVTINKSILEEMQTKLGLLEQAVSKPRLQQAQMAAKSREKRVYTCHFKKIRGYVVVGIVPYNSPDYKGEMDYITNPSAQAPVGEVMKIHLKVLVKDKEFWKEEDMVVDFTTLYRCTDLEYADIVSADNKTDNVEVKFHNPLLPQSYTVKRSILNT